MLHALMAQVRAAHLMVRSEEDWDYLSSELGVAYAGKDDELIELLRGPYLKAWRTVTGNLLGDQLAAAGITVSRPAHPWSIAALERNGIVCEPLLCSLDDELPDAREAAAVYGGLQLRPFKDVMAGYVASLEELIGPPRGTPSTSFER